MLMARCLIVHKIVTCSCVPGQNAVHQTEYCQALGLVAEHKQSTTIASVCIPKEYVDSINQTARITE